MALKLNVQAARLLKNVLEKRIKLKSFSLTRCNFCSTTETKKSGLPYSDRDPAPLFFNPKVLSLLQNITQLDLEKINAPKKMIPTDPEYQFVTERELKRLEDEAKERAKEKLAMPPVLQERKPINEVLSRDPELIGYDNCTIIFTDVSFGISDQSRIIVARDTDGTLRKATWDERHRMNQIFFPVKGRELTMPKLFEDEYLQKALKERYYKFILDRACIQFEPDDPKYITVTTTTYDHIDSTKSFDDLRSTRHFGPMAFYYTFYQKIDNLLIDMINREKLENATDLINLFHIIHPKCKSAQTVLDSSISFPLIKAYMDNDSSKRNSVGFALRSYEELQRQKSETAAGMKAAHGNTN